MFLVVNVYNTIKSIGNLNQYDNVRHVQRPTWRFKNINKHPLKVREPPVRVNAARSSQQERQRSDGAESMPESLQIEMPDEASPLEAAPSNIRQ